MNKPAIKWLSLKWLPGIFFILCLLSCATVMNTGIDASVAAGSFTQALQEIDKERTAKGSVYADKNNEILFYLDRGMVNHYAGRYAESAEDLAEAERLIEEAYTKSLTQELTSYIANDNSKDYSGEDYEDLYINVFNALNYYHLGDTEGALVEIRRVNEKLAVLGDKYERGSDKVLSATSDLAGADLGVEAVRFSNSALAHYLSLLFFRAKGSDDDVRIDLEELRRAYELAPAVYGNSPPSSLEEERSVPQGMARLNVIGFTGLSPVKEEQEINIPLLVLPPITLALPRMVERPSDVESVEVALDTGQRFALELLEDTGRVAQETFKGKYGLTVAKTAARTVIKTAASAGAAKLAERAPGGPLTGFAVGIAGKAITDASERADLRMSRYFPGRTHVGGINLQPGIYSVTVNYYGSGGRLIATDRQDDVPVGEGQLNLAQFVRLGSPSSASTPPANVASARGTSAVAATAATPPPLPVPLAAVTQQKPRLGILPFTGGSVGDGEAMAVLFSMQDNIREAFTVVPRTNEVNAAVAERSFQSSRSIDADTIARLGQMLDVDYVISGYFRRLGDNSLLIASIVNVETLELVAGDYRQYGSIEDIPAMLPSITGNMAANAMRDRSRLPTLAIAPFRGDVTEDVEVLAHILPIAIANTGRYAVSLRTSPSNADHVLSSEVRTMGTMKILAAQILDAGNGNELTGDSLNYRVVWDGIALVPQLATVLTSRGSTSVASLGSQSASVPATASAAAPATATTVQSSPTPPPLPVQPVQSSSVQDDTDNDAWKNKWLYLGGGLGLGFGSYNYYNGRSYYEGTGDLIDLGFVADFALLPFFSIETGFRFSFWSTDEEGLGIFIVAPVLAKLGGRIAKIELSFDAGYIFGMGLAYGGTFGFKAGPGIIFFKGLYVPDASPPGDINFKSIFVLYTGYKVGIITRRR